MRQQVYAKRLIISGRGTTERQLNFGFDAAGAHNAPAPQGFVKGKHATSHKNESREMASQDQECSRHNQNNSEGRPHHPPPAGNIGSKEATHAALIVTTSQ